MSIKPQLDKLQSYSACDIADALDKLGQYANAGQRAPQTLASLTSVQGISSQKIVAPAATTLFINAKASPQEGDLPTRNITQGTPYADLTRSDTIVVLSQPEGQSNAVLGGLNALRMQKLGAKGVVVFGQVRDVSELGETGLPVWALGTSTHGSRGYTVAHATDVPLQTRGWVIHPGDIVFLDPASGMEVIPRDLLRQVIDLLPTLVEADERVREDVKAAKSLKDAFATHRT